MWVSFCSVSCHLSAGARSGQVSQAIFRSNSGSFIAQKWLSASRGEREELIVVCLHAVTTLPLMNQREKSGEVTLGGHKGSFLPTNRSLCKRSVAGCQSLFYVLSHQNICIFNSCFKGLLAALLYLSNSYRFWIAQIATKAGY